VVALRAGIVAFFVEQLDIYLPVLVLASVGDYFVPSGTGGGTSDLLTALIFAAALVTRPIGAAVFGHIADRVGRARTTRSATIGFAVVTLLIAALPGADSIGYASIGGLIFLRAVNGFFLGGAYTASVPLAMEWALPQRRGLIAGQILSASPAAYATLALTALLLQEVMSSSGTHSSYARWGWRIPFVVVACLGFLLAMVYRRYVVEPDGAARGRAARPLAELLTGRHRRALVQVLILMTGVWLANNMVSAVLPKLLRSRLDLSGPEVSLVMAVESIVLAFAFVAAGVASQHWGRRRFYIVYGLVMAVAGAGLYAVLITSRPELTGAILLTPLIGIATLGSFGPIAAYLTERFPSELRATGFGVGYSLALVIPAFYAFYISGLERVLPDELPPVLLIVLAGLFVAVGGKLGPETKDVSFGGDERRPAAVAPVVGE
jgi:MFS family permease